MPDGFKKVLSRGGVVVLQKDETVSIPSEIDYLLKDRTSSEKYLQQAITASLFHQK